MTTASGKRASSRTPFRAAAVVLCVTFAAVLAGLNAGSASSLGGLRSTALAAASAANGATLDSFADSAARSLTSRATSCGKVWSVSGGSLYTTGSGAAVADGGSMVTGTLPQCATAPAPTGVAALGTAKGSGNFGVLMHAAAGGRPATAAVFVASGGGSVSLRRIEANGSYTTLATGSGGGGSSGDTRALSLQYASGVYTVRVNGLSVATYTVPVAQRVAYQLNSGLGVVSFADSRSTFEQVLAL